MTKTMNHADQGGLTLVGGNFTPPIHKQAVWRPPAMADLPSSWKGVRRLGLDTETKDVDLQELGPGIRRPGNYMVGVSFAIEGGPAHYLPFRHEGGDNMDPVQVKAYLKDQFKTFDGEVVGMNLPYDLDWLWEWGVEMPCVKAYRDVGVAAPLLYELHQSYNLENIADRIGLPGKNEVGLREAAAALKLHPKKDIWRMAARHVGPYATDDAIRPLEVLALQDQLIDDDGIRKCWDMETKLLPILVRMTRRGIPVNEDRLAQVEQWINRREQEEYDIVKDWTKIAIPVGHSMDVDLLKRALLAVGLDDCIGTNTKGDSVTKDLLAASDHPVAQALVRARQVATVRTTFVNGVRRHLVNGKIHCTFNQIRKTDDESGENSGVAYGRISASHPNMQNQPGNSRFSGDNEIGPMWRSIYQCDWTACDLKQQEPKWSFHYGAILEELGIPGVVGAIALCKRFQENPHLDTYEPIVDIAKVPRPRAKIIWLARTYGQGDGTLCEALGLPTRLVVFSMAVYRDALNQGLTKWAAKKLATVAADSPEGQAVVGGFAPWKGAGAEGKVIIDNFDSEMPFLKVCADIAKERANEYGYVKLLSGRRCHFEKAGGKYEWTHKALNRIVQGTAAEQTKEITIAVSEAGFDEHLILQVHDELDFRDFSDAQAKACAEVMAHTVPMKMPTIVDIERGPSWGESMGVEYKNKEGQKCKTTYKWHMLIVDGEPKYFENPLVALDWKQANKQAKVEVANVPSDDQQQVRGDSPIEAFVYRTKATFERETIPDVPRPALTPTGQVPPEIVETIAEGDNARPALTPTGGQT